LGQYRLKLELRGVPKVSTSARPPAGDVLLANAMVCFRAEVVRKRRIEKSL
jgi:hypothetical protein